MFLRRKVKKLDEDVTRSFKNVRRDIEFLIDGFDSAHERADSAHRIAESTEEEIATNGVVRDIRDLQKRVAFLEDENQKLKTNGVATAINKLNNEVFKTRKDAKVKIYSSPTLAWLSSYYFGDEAPKKTEEATLAGKVDAIIAHLGLDVTVKPEEKTEAKVIAKKVTTKKKGKK